MSLEGLDPGVYQIQVLKDRQVKVISRLIPVRGQRRKKEKKVPTFAEAWDAERLALDSFKDLIADQGLLSKDHKTLDLNGPRLMALYWAITYPGVDLLKPGVVKNLSTESIYQMLCSEFTLPKINSARCLRGEYASTKAELKDRLVQTFLSFIPA
jgi:hypothetical protein